MNRFVAIVIVSNFLTVIGAMALFYKTWLPSIMPGMFYIYRIYYNNFLNYKDKLIFKLLKGDKTRYYFNQLAYSHSGVKPYINGQGVYTWNFQEGQLKPIRLQENSENIDGKLIAQETKMTLDSLWFSGNNFQEIMQKYGIWIIIGLIFFLFIYLNVQNQTTTRLLLNMTQRS
jgi:hypothetical protein